MDARASLAGRNAGHSGSDVRVCPSFLSVAVAMVDGAGMDERTLEGRDSLVDDDTRLDVVNGRQQANLSVTTYVDYAGGCSLSVPANLYALIPGGHNGGCSIDMLNSFH